MKIEIKINDNFYETDSPFKVFAFATAVNFYGFYGGTAQELAELCHMLYVDFHSVNAVDLIDYVCEHYDDLPDDYNEILNILEGAL